MKIKLYTAFIVLCLSHSVSLGSGLLCDVCHKPARSKVYNYDFSGVSAENFNPDFVELSSGETLLDVGAGDGVVTKKLVAKAGKKNCYALEPKEEKFRALKEVVDESQSVQSTLQQYVETENIQKFDAVTIFKYSVPVDQKESFFNSLLRVIHAKSTVYITSVERDQVQIRCPRFYIMTVLQKRFGSIEEVWINDKYGFHAYSIVTCKKPIFPKLIIPTTKSSHTEQNSEKKE